MLISTMSCQPPTWQLAAGKQVDRYRCGLPATGGCPTVLRLILSVPGLYYHEQRRSQQISVGVPFHLSRVSVITAGSARANHEGGCTFPAANNSAPPEDSLGARPFWAWGQRAPFAFFLAWPTMQA